MPNGGRSTRTWRSLVTPSRNLSRPAPLVGDRKPRRQRCTGWRSTPVQAERSGLWASWPGREPCSMTVGPPTCCTRKPSSVCGTAESPSTSRAPISCVANGCAVRIVAARRVNTCASPSTCCTVSERVPSRNAPVADWVHSASPCVSGRPTRTRPLPRRKPTSPGWPLWGRRTWRSAPSCSSATHRRMAFAQGVHQARRGFTYPARRGTGASVTTASRLSMTRKVGSALGPPPSTDVR